MLNWRAAMGGEWIFRTDDDGHWYLIPLHMAEEFDSLLSLGQDEDDYLDFEMTFGACRSDGPHAYVFAEFRHR